VAIGKLTLCRLSLRGSACRFRDPWWVEAPLSPCARTEAGPSETSTRATRVGHVRLTPDRDQMLSKGWTLAVGIEDILAGV
jgi:hypothetical protein